MDYKFNVQTFTANKIELRGFHDRQEAIKYWQSKLHEGLKSFAYEVNQEQKALTLN